MPLAQRFCACQLEINSAQFMGHMRTAALIEIKTPLVVNRLTIGI